MCFFTFTPGKNFWTSMRASLEKAENWRLLQVSILKCLQFLCMCALSTAHKTLFEGPFDWNLNPLVYKSIRPVKCLTHFYLTVSSFLLAFLIWTNWSRCHSPPILTLSRAFHYRVLDCTEVWDKLVMSKVKLYPGLCNSIHLSKRGGGKKLLKRNVPSCRFC